MSDASTALAVIAGPLVPAVVFGPGGVDDVLKQIKAKVASVEIDIATPQGRKECASLAYQIARSKTALDEMGKELGEDHYRAWKSITSERARIVKELDALKDEVRQPLTDWENADKARIEAHQAAIKAIEAVGLIDVPAESAGIKARIDSLRAPDSRNWHEFAKRADDARAAALGRLLSLHETAVNRETAEAEAKRIAAEKAEQERRAHDALVAETARREAEAKAAAEAAAQACRVQEEMNAAAEKARREREAIEAEKAAAEARARKAEEDRLAAEAKARADAEAARIKAEADRKAAAEKAERDKQAAIEAERKRIADEQAREVAAAAAREADRKHKASVNGAARDALVKEAGLSEQAATAAITAIAKGAIPNVRISY
jgi:colicin import membrane protein